MGRRGICTAYVENAPTHAFRVKADGHVPGPNLPADTTSRFSVFTLVLVDASDAGKIDSLTQCAITGVPGVPSPISLANC